MSRRKRIERLEGAVDTLLIALAQQTLPDEWDQQSRRIMTERLIHFRKIATSTDNPSLTKRVNDLSQDVLALQRQVWAAPTEDTRSRPQLPAPATDGLKRANSVAAEGEKYSWPRTFSADLLCRAGC